MVVRDILAEELFPHIGSEDKAYEKACFLAHITRKVLWVSSAAQVIEHIEAGTNKGKTLWRCKVRFLDTSQNQVEAVDKYATSTDPQPVGTQVIILYPHGRPDKVHCYSPLTFYAVPVLFVSIGIAALLAF
jgi:hypothetical protein